MFKHLSGVINDETKRLRFQVEKVLQVSLYEHNKARYNKRELDMNKVIEDVAHTYLIKVKNVNGTLTTDLGAEHSIVYGDEIHLTNVIFNLLDNALKYRREEEPLKLRITTRNDGNHMVISIEDNGIGIKREKPSQDIRPFLQSAYRQPPRRKGFGLGLAYVKTDCESARWKHTRRKPIRSRHQLCNNITNNKKNNKLWTNKCTSFFAKTTKI